MYRIIRGFYDLQDKEKGAYHWYEVGDTYPREGVEPDSERIAFLASAGNKIGTPVIEEIPEEPAAEADPEEAPAEEKPKRRAKK